MDFMTGLALGAGLGFVAVVVATREKSKRLRLSVLMNFKFEVEKILETLREKTNAANALLIRVHNGGGDIKVTSILYSSVVSEATEVSFQDWQSIKLDRDYLSTLINIQAKSRDVVYTRELSGLLRARYEALGYEGALLSEVYNQGGNSVYFLSLPFTSGIDKALDGRGINHVYIAENALRNALQNLAGEDMLD